MRSLELFTERTVIALPAFDDVRVVRQVCAGQALLQVARSGQRESLTGGMHEGGDLGIKVLGRLSACLGCLNQAGRKFLRRSMGYCRILNERLARSLLR